MANEPKQTDTAPAVNVINTDPMLQFLERKANVSAEELKVLSAIGGATEVLVPGEVTFTTGDGKTRTRPKTIQDVNTSLVYAKIEPDSLKRNPVFMKGWFPVKNTNDGGKGVPEHYFDQNGFVFFGESMLVWTTRQYYDERFEKPHREQLQASLGRVSGGLGSSGVDQDFKVERDD